MLHLTREQKEEWAKVLGMTVKNFLRYEITDLDMLRSLMRQHNERVREENVKQAKNNS